MNDIVIRNSRYSFPETIARLTKTITDTGNRVFADIDQSAAARSVGLTLRPTRLLIFGNPKGGTLLMDASPLIALDLPLKLLVWEENDKVEIAYTAVPALIARYGVTGMDAPIAAMSRTLENIVVSAA